MKCRTFISGGNVIYPDGIKKTTVVIENNKIVDADYNGIIPEDSNVINAKGMYVAPGIIDVHVHGGGNYDFMDCTPDAFNKIAVTHLSHGVTSIMPTTVACSFEALSNLFSVYRTVKHNSNTLNFIGLHLEGPYISYDMRGAQNPRYIRNPSAYEVDRLIDEGGDIIRLCTAAPEIDGIEYMAKRMIKNNIMLSVGHSGATFRQTQAAMELGFNHVTHLYSGTSTVKKINQRIYAGILEAAYYFDNMRIELIGDGRHVAEETLRLALKIKGADKINITSDAMRAAGADVTESYLGEIKPENKVIIEDGVAKLPDRSFYAGSIATGDIMLKWLVNTCGVSLTNAFKMLSLSPAILVGTDSAKGSIENGKDADIILLDYTLSAKTAIVSGKIR